MFKLRTRLFVAMAIVLGASIAASGLLSRRATLVEVREVVSRPVAVRPGALDAIGARVEAVMREHGAAGLEAMLSEAGREAGRPLVLIDAGRRILAGSTPELSAAQVQRATPDGELRLEVGISRQPGSGTGQPATGGRIEDRSVIAVRGPRPAAIRAAQGGQPMAYLYALPPREDREPERGGAWRGRFVAPWVAGTASVALVAVLLTFALSRRILRPIGALTAAAERMHRGDLNVQVDVQGSDEMADLSRAFNAMAVRLAETEHLRRQMVGDVAHELRSPVTHLRCSLEAIQDGLVLPDRAAIDGLHEETLFLQRLIADLQDLALADAGRLGLAIALVDVAHVIERAAASTNGQGPAPIALDIGPALPSIQADADRIEQVLRNLLSNARRHTPAGGTIRVTAAGGRDSVRISVTDSGCGIEPEHLAHVFDRFYRADSSRARETGGAGLGLAIARQLTAAHGGTIEAISDGAGRGATFVVVLPVGR